METPGNGGTSSSYDNYLTITPSYLDLPGNPHQLAKKRQVDRYLAALRRELNGTLCQPAVQNPSKTTDRLPAPGTDGGHNREFVSSGFALDPTRRRSRVATDPVGREVHLGDGDLSRRVVLDVVFELAKADPDAIRPEAPLVAELVEARAAGWQTALDVLVELGAVDESLTAEPGPGGDSGRLPHPDVAFTLGHRRWDVDV